MPGTAGRASGAVPAEPAGADISAYGDHGNAAGERHVQGGTFDIRKVEPGDWAAKKYQRLVRRSSGRRWRPVPTWCSYPAARPGWKTGGLYCATPTPPRRPDLYRTRYPFAFGDGPAGSEVTPLGVTLSPLPLLAAHAARETASATAAAPAAARPESVVVGMRSPYPVCVRTPAG